MDETEKENMELLSVEEAAAYLKFSTTFVYRLAREKRIPHVSYGRHIIFRKTDLCTGLEVWFALFVNLNTQATL